MNEELHGESNKKKKEAEPSANPATAVKTPEMDTKHEFSECQTERDGAAGEKSNK